MNTGTGLCAIHVRVFRSLCERRTDWTSLADFRAITRHLGLFRLFWAVISGALALDCPWLGRHVRVFGSPCAGQIDRMPWDT